VVAPLSARLDRFFTMRTREGGVAPSLQRGGLLFFRFALALQVSRVRALVSLNILEPSFLVADGIKLGARRTAVSCPLRRHGLPRRCYRAASKSWRGPLGYQPRQSVGALQLASKVYGFLIGRQDITCDPMPDWME
jgi:hypothetical protein